MTRLVIVGNEGIVHEFGGERKCYTIDQVYHLIRVGRADHYLEVTPRQIEVFKLPGCRSCFISEPIFKARVSART